MPRDNMAALIQRVARQARVTFRSPAGPGFGEDLQRLRQLLDEVRAEDLHLAPRGPAAAAPVSYMHICETESFSMGVFLLRSGACIPLHDHPGMNGMLKVLYGTLRIACMDALPAASSSSSSPPPPLAPPYDPEHGRDCHYYRLLEGPPPGPEPPALPREVWLQETAPAADFWCGGEPYPGPRVCP
ncbi:AEDO dioxygenase, partial [Penelope pileata]|nr:AEDO dioxygenase [Penelope pileata]